MEATLSRLRSGVVLRNGQGTEVRGNLVHLTRDSIVFEVYDPQCDLRLGETISNLSVIRGGTPIYSGGAVINGVLATGLLSMVTATPAGSWAQVDELRAGGRLFSDADLLLQDWDVAPSLAPAYQLAVGRIRAFLTELSRWTVPIDLAAGVSGNLEPAELLRSLAEALYPVVEPRLRQLFEQWEASRQSVPPEDVPAHRVFVQRELHPLTLCVPILHRAYVKPLGYAGDYEMVNIILRNQAEGPSTYARVMNAFIVRRDLGVAHRKRIEKLTEYLSEEVRRVARQGRPLRVLNVGCGPVAELESFLRADGLAGNCQLTLLDFNAETIEYARKRMESAMDGSGRRPVVEYEQQSIMDLLRDAARGVNGSARNLSKYDLVYCAGLFDYLSDRVCSRLLDLLCSWTAPGGRVVATNVHPGHHLYTVMEDLLEWHLTLRTEAQMRRLAPQNQGQVTVGKEGTGVNVILQIRKSG